RVHHPPIGVEAGELMPLERKDPYPRDAQEGARVAIERQDAQVGAAAKRVVGVTDAVRALGKAAAWRARQDLDADILSGPCQAGGARVPRQRRARDVRIGPQPLGTRRTRVVAGEVMTDVEVREVPRARHQGDAPMLPRDEAMQLLVPL